MELSIFEFDDFVSDDPSATAKQQELSVLWGQYTKYVDESKGDWIKALNNPERKIIVELPDYVTKLMDYERDHYIEYYVHHSMKTEYPRLKVWIRFGQGENWALHLSAKLE